MRVIMVTSVIGRIYIIAAIIYNMILQCRATKYIDEWGHYGISLDLKICFFSNTRERIVQ